MTTFAARANSLTIEIQKLDRLKNAAHDLKNYQSRLDKLGEALAKLSPPAEFLQLLAARGIAALPSASPAEGTARALATTLARRFATDVSVVLSVEFAAFLKALTAAQEQLAAQARASWKSYSMPLAGSVSRELLDALQRIEAFRTTVQRIRRPQAEIDQLVAEEWVTETGLDRFDSLIEARAKAWDELEAGGAIPDGVVEFLKQCNRGGVRLDAVNDGALEWLKTRDILGCFRIVL